MPSTRTETALVWLLAKEAVYHLVKIFLKEQMYYQMLYKLVLMEEFYLIGHKQQSTHMGIFYGL